MNDNTKAGLLCVQEADCVPHVHPAYGSGLFFTEDAIIDQPATKAVPQGVASDLMNRVLAYLRRSQNFKLATELNAALAGQVAPSPEPWTAKQAELLDAVMRDTSTDVKYRMQRIFKVLSVAFEEKPKPWGVAASAGDALTAEKAAMYDWLRKQYWFDSKVCVVLDPKNALKLGSDTLSEERLDDFIREQMKGA